MQHSVATVRESKPKIVIFSDMDGTLLDPVTYSWKDAEPALRQCRNRSIPVILNSSKTRSEIDHFRQAADLSWPYVVENGGGIYFPSNSILADPAPSDQNENLDQIAIGVSYSRLCEALKHISAHTGLILKGFSQMSPDEIMALTGLNPNDARRAATREFDEPFCLNHDTPHAVSRLRHAAGLLGLKITSGGRFYHLHGQFDKGTAVRLLSKRYGQVWKNIMTIGLGDSDNDIPMLEVVDTPIWVAPAGQQVPGHIPGLRRSVFSGPKAWNQMVLSIINS